MHKTIISLLAVAVLGGAVLAGCGSDSDREEAGGAAVSTTEATGATTTTVGGQTLEQFCAEVQTAFGDYQPGFDAIFEDNPDPSLEEWAAFLPAATEEFDEMIARVAAVEPAPEVADEFEAAIDAMETVSQNFHGSIEAAAAGDQATFDELETQNQEVDLPAMDAALNSTPDRCASEG